MTRNGIVKQKRAHYFNRGTLSDSVLFFAFSLIAFGIKEKERTLILFSYEIYTAPYWGYIFYGTLTLLLSIVLFIAAFNERLAGKIDKLIKGPSGVIYWTYFWLVYTLTWLKGLALVPQDKFIFHLVAYMGAVLLVFLTIIWFRGVYKSIRWLREFHFKGSVK